MTLRELSESDYPALLELLKDRGDDELRQMIQAQLEAMGMESLRHLRSLAVYAPDQTMMDIEAILQRKLWAQLGEELPLLLLPGRQSMLDSLLFLTRFGHLDYFEETLRTDCARVVDACRARLSTRDSHERAADKIADTLGNELGFTGNTDEYYDPENSYLDSVLRTRRGIPISLSALYIHVGEQLGVPIKGVAMPGHFIVGLFEWEVKAVYYDPFNHGVRLTKLDCSRLVQRTGHAFDESAMRPIAVPLILQRMMTNLHHVYGQRGEDDRREALQHFLKLLSDATG